MLTPHALLSEATIFARGTPSRGDLAAVAFAACLARNLDPMGVDILTGLYFWQIEVRALYLTAAGVYYIKAAAVGPQVGGAL